MSLIERAFGTVEGPRVWYYRGITIETRRGISSKGFPWVSTFEMWDNRYTTPAQTSILAETVVKKRIDFLVLLRQACELEWDEP